MNNRIKVAIATNKGYFCGSFERCSYFTIYTIEMERIVEKSILENRFISTGTFVTFLSEKNVQCVIVGSMDVKMRNECEKKGIVSIVGVSGSLDMIIDEYISHTLCSLNT